MGQTRYFGLSFFDFGDQLEAPINVQKETDRFVVIDKQLYGLYKIFGNGVISGWSVSDAGYSSENGISISISTGQGIIKSLASQTDLPGRITNLPPNSVVDIYATLTGTTVYDRAVNFVSSTIAISSEEHIKIARVATGSNSVLYTDNTVRDLIGFEQIIEDQINSHKHRGTPTKIDLKEEVKNQLPGARIEGIDASKITSGTFNINRIPLVDHNDLENNGLLTHSALDSFVKTLSKSNKELLGEISTTNLIKTILYLKYRYSNIDEFFTNELAIIPGISPDSFIDFEASTANINMEDGCISGFPASTGIFSSIYWNSSFSFSNYYSISGDTGSGTDNFVSNFIIENDTISLNPSSISVEMISDFSDEQKGFVSSTQIVSDNQQVKIITENQNRLLEIGGGQEIAYYYIKTFSTPRNWDGVYDELSIKVKTMEEIHSPLYLYIVNGVDSNNNEIKKPSSDWILIEQDESFSTLTEKVFDISTLGLDNVTKIVLWTEDDFTFKIDDILVRRKNMYPASGTVKYRYTTQSNIIFHSIFYDIDTPYGTSSSVSIKVSPSSDLLSRTAYTLPLNSGDVFSLSGSAIEIKVDMLSNDSRTSTPVLSNIELRLQTDADFTGFSINTQAEWERGVFENVETVLEAGTDNADIILTSPINVGGRYFSRSSAISEINDENVGLLGFGGNLMPVSPNQAKNWRETSCKGFNVVSSVERQFDKTFLIADTYNNRVVEVDSNGNMVRGIGSTYTTDSNLYPVSSIYNPVNKILTIVFTKSVTIKDITKIFLYLRGAKISLTENDEVSSEKRASGKILKITINDDTATRLIGATSDLYVYIGSGAFTEDIVVNDSMSYAKNSIYSIKYGFVCYIGDFTYMENIMHPIFVGKTINGNWIVCNSSIHYTALSQEDETISVPDIVEIDPLNPEDTNNKMIVDYVKFSDFSLGSVLEYDEGRFVVAGLVESENSLNVNGDDLRNKYSGTIIPSNIEFRASAVDSLKGYAGGVYSIDKTNNRSQVFYTSPDGIYPSDISEFSNGDFLVAESSFYNSSGRMVRLDSFGNVSWNYGSGVFNIINDAKVLSDDIIIIST